ncbi:MAG: glycosyltransferase [Isosphaeraceae bacterium]
MDGTEPIAWDWAIADAGWTWTQRLFRPFGDLGQNLLLLDPVDWTNAYRQSRPIRRWLGGIEPDGPNTWRSSMALPTGWMKRFPKVGMKPIAGAIRRWRTDSPRPLALVASYPHYLYLDEMIRPDHLIYYNMDDYALYWPGRADEVRRLEDEIVRRARLSVVCAARRAEELRDRVPEAADRILHWPHGAPESSIPDRPQHRPASPPADIAHLPRPLLGFVGSLENRLDWRLIGQLADAFPQGSIVLIGRPPHNEATGEWMADYRQAVARPNVHRLGWRTQDEIGRYNAAFDVCLIPYRVDHPFNRACCPTKIMDYMATTRPVVATDLPECRLYADLFDVADSGGVFIEAARRIVESGGDDGRAKARWLTARERTWTRAADGILGRIQDVCRSDPSPESWLMPIEAT